VTNQMIPSNTSEDNPFTPQQMSFLESILDPRVRRFRNERGLYISPLDVFEYHGKAASPTAAWERLLNGMIKRQGFTLEYDDMIYVQFSGQGGRFTPMITEKFFTELLCAHPYLNGSHYASL